MEVTAYLAGGGRRVKLPTIPNPFEWFMRLFGFPSDKQVQAVTGVPGMTTESGRRVYAGLTASNKVLVPAVEGALRLMPGYDLATSITGQTVTGTPLSTSERVMGLAFTGFTVTPFDDLLGLIRAGNVRRDSFILKETIGMDRAIDAAVEFVGGDGRLITTGKGGNFQFMRTYLDSQGRQVTNIGRLDVNLTESGEWLGQHLNLEQHINGQAAFNYHVRIDPLTIRPGDIP